MRLWYDPTEGRRGSNLPDNVVQFGTSLPGLEGTTGADLLLSPLVLPEVDVLDVKGKVGLAQHCQAGLLVQRKSGMDLVGSMGRLAAVECKMQKWGGAWLLFTGRVQSRGGVAVVNGRKSVVGYKQLIAALDAWQLRGGGVTWLEKDEEIGSWVEMMLRKLVEMWSQPEREVEIGVRKQTLSKVEMATEEQAAVYTLETFPGIGFETAQRVVREKGGRLCKVLEWMSRDGEGVRGVGRKTVEKGRQWMGLKKGEVMEIIKREGDV